MERVKAHFVHIAQLDMQLAKIKKVAFLLELMISYFIVKFIIILLASSNVLFVKYYLHLFIV